MQARAPLAPRPATPVLVSALPVLMALAALLAPAGASAASDYLLRLDGVQGTVGGHAEIAEFRWSRATANAAFDPFQPAFAGGARHALASLVRDAPWETLVLSAIDPDVGGFFRYEMRNVYVSSYSVSGAGRSGLGGPGGLMAPANSGEPRDWVLLEALASPVLHWAPRLPDGSPGDWISGTWDADSGRFVGDAGVFAVFEVLGATRSPDGTLAISAVPEPAGWALWLLGAAAMAQRLQRARATA